MNKKTIKIVRDDTREGLWFKAFLMGEETSTYGLGKTTAEAIGNLISSNPADFNLILSFDIN